MAVTALYPSITLTGLAAPVPPNPYAFLLPPPTPPPTYQPPTAAPIPPNPIPMAPAPVLARPAGSQPPSPAIYTALPVPDPLDRIGLPPTPFVADPITGLAIPPTAGCDPLAAATMGRTCIPVPKIDAPSVGTYFPNAPATLPPAPAPRPGYKANILPPPALQPSKIALNGVSVPTPVPPLTPATPAPAKMLDGLPDVRLWPWWVWVAGLAGFILVARGRGGYAVVGS
jgi:hypothetical protein